MTITTCASLRVIELDTISQHMAGVVDPPLALLGSYYPAFRRFGRMLQSPKYLMRLRLSAGECIAFDNPRIVHGGAS